MHWRRTCPQNTLERLSEITETWVQRNSAMIRGYEKLKLSSSARKWQHVSHYLSYFPSSATTLLSPTPIRAHNRFISELWNTFLMLSTSYSRICRCPGNRYAHRANIEIARTKPSKLILTSWLFSGQKRQSAVSHNWCDQFCEWDSVGSGASVHRSVGHHVDYDEKRKERSQTLQENEVRFLHPSGG